MRRILIAPTLLLLAACGGGEPTRTASLAVAPPSSADYGTLRVRYQAVPASSLSETAARAYAVEAKDTNGVILIGLRTHQANLEAPLNGAVTATAIDLQGERQAIRLKEIRSGDYVDHVGSFHISPRNSYRFEVSIDAAGQRQQLKFQRAF